VLRAALAEALEETYYYRMLAILLQQMGRYEEACHLIAKAIDIDPHDAQLRVQHGELLASTRRDAEAAEALAAATTLEPEDRTVLQRRISLLRGLGRLDQAIDVARMVVALAPDDARSHVVLSQLLLLANRGDEAVAAAYRAVSSDPMNADASAQLGAALRHQGDFLAAERAMLKAIELSSSTAHYWHELSVTYARQMRLSDAVAAGLRAVVEEPDNPHRLVHVGALMEMANRHADAFEAVTKAMRMAPGNEAFRTVLDRLQVKGAGPGPEKRRSADPELARREGGGDQFAGAG
jgi:tetratricopeptide (TPR) repeat protein